MFKLRFLRSSKCPKTTWSSPEQSAELTEKLITGTAALMIFSCYHNCWSLFMLS